MKTFTYKNQKPRLTVELVGTKELGNCQRKTRYKVTTSPLPLTEQKVRALRFGGFLGGGLKLLYKDRNFPEASEPLNTKPTGFDKCPCIVMDDYDILDESPASSIGKEYAPSHIPYFVYEFEDFDDTGD